MTPESGALRPRSPYDNFHGPKRRRRPRWLPVILEQIHELASARRVRFTLKALRELATLEVGRDEEDAREILQRLRASDRRGRLRSERTGEWLYVFLPDAGGETLYVKLLLRSSCVVISFHEQVDDEEENYDS